MTGKEQVIRLRLIRSRYAIVAVLALRLCGATAFAQSVRTEDVTFPTNVVSNTTAGTPVLLSAKLFIPVSSGGPMSAVVITPSSGGVKAEIEIFYAQKLADAGIAALVVDSFRSRGLVNSIYDQTVLTAWATQNDAWAAFRWLVRDGRFSKDRIGLTGVSTGGIAALQPALRNPTPAPPNLAGGRGGVGPARPLAVRRTELGVDRVTEPRPPGAHPTIGPAAAGARDHSKSWAAI